jgi:hypothetical protein
MNPRGFPGIEKRERCPAVAMGVERYWGGLSSVDLFNF